MMHVHSPVVVTSRTAGRDLQRCVVVPIDIGKSIAVAAVEDFTGAKLCRPIEFTLNADGVAGLLAAVTAVLGLPPVLRGLTLVSWSLSSPTKRSQR